MSSGLTLCAFAAYPQVADPNELLDRGEVAEACAQADDSVTRTDTPDGWFARGRCAALHGDHAAAIVWFRKILTVADAGRTRLELARSLAKAGLLPEARAEYDAVMRTGPPPIIRRWIGEETAALEPAEAGLRTRWRVGVSPLWDSNVNVGPVDRSITLFDLPFELNDASVGRSDAGLIGWVGFEVEQATPLGSVTWAAREEATVYREASFANLNHLNASVSLVHPTAWVQWTGSASIDHQSQPNGNRSNDVIGSVQAFVPFGMHGTLAWASSLQADLGRVSSQAAEMPKATQSTLAGVSPALHVRTRDGLELLAGVRWGNESFADPSRTHRDLGWRVSTSGPVSLLCTTCTWSVLQTTLRSNYGDVDPLFGVVRGDQLRVRSLTLRSSAADRSGSPAYSLLVEGSRNRSTLPLYRYHRTRAVLSSEWVF